MVGKATVIRYLQGGAIQILLADGGTSPRACRMKEFSVSGTRVVVGWALFMSLISTAPHCLGQCSIPTDQLAFWTLPTCAMREWGTEWLTEAFLTHPHRFGSLSLNHPRLSQSKPPAETDGTTHVGKERV